MAARRAPLIATAGAGAAGWGYTAAGRGDYIEGEVIDVRDDPADPAGPVVDPHAVERKPD
jgi:UPF0716 protein FxsA